MRRRLPRLNSLPLALVVAGAAWLAAAPGASGPSPFAPAAHPGPPALAPGAVASDEPRAEPARGQRAARGRALAVVAIPAIGVRAPVIAVGLNRDRSLQVPASAAQAGWWSGGPRPGDDGAAVIVGHVTSRAGAGAFFRLHELAPGDEIRVERAGRPAARFAVERVREVGKDDFPTLAVYGDTSAPALRLVTCAGRFDERRRSYERNLIVFARGVER